MYSRKLNQIYNGTTFKLKRYGKALTTQYPYYPYPYYYPIDFSTDLTFPGGPDNATDNTIKSVLSNQIRVDCSSNVLNNVREKLKKILRGNSVTNGELGLTTEPVNSENEEHPHEVIIIIITEPDASSEDHGSHSEEFLFGNPNDKDTRDRRRWTKDDAVEWLFKGFGSRIRSEFQRALIWSVRGFAGVIGYRLVMNWGTEEERDIFLSYLEVLGPY